MMTILESVRYCIVNMQNRIHCCFMILTENLARFVSMNHDRDLDPFLLRGYIRIYIKLSVPEDIFNLLLLWYDKNTICLYARLYNGLRVRIPVNPKWEIWKIKQSIFSTQKISVNQQILQTANTGKPLRDHAKIHDFNLHNNDEILVQFKPSGN